jgi:hypothetical protein
LLLRCTKRQLQASGMFRVLGVVASKFPETFSPLSGAKRKNIMKNIRFYSTIVKAVAVGTLILI